MNALFRPSARPSRLPLRNLAPLVASAALAVIVSGQPAAAHSIAGGGLASGFLHPLMGSDHLLLLVGVGAASASLSAQLLLWGLAGALAGGVYGALGGGLPAAEVLAALAISAVAALVLRRQASPSTDANPALGLAGSPLLLAVCCRCCCVCALGCTRRGLRAPRICLRRGSALQKRRSGTQPCRRMYK